jgi:hypothetical protein
MTTWQDVQYLTSCQSMSSGSESLKQLSERLARESSDSNSTAQFDAMSSVSVGGHCIGIVASPRARRRLGNSRKKALRSVSEEKTSGFGDDNKRVYLWFHTINVISYAEHNLKMRKAYLHRITIIWPLVKTKWDPYSAGIALAQEFARDAMLFKTLADFLRRRCLDRHCIEVAECNRGFCHHAWSASAFLFGRARWKPPPV